METVYCELKYSGAGVAFLLAAAAATLALVLFGPFDALWRATLAGWVVASACAGLEALHRFARLRACIDGSVRLERRDGGVVDGRIRAGSFVAPWLVVLRYRPDGARLDRTVVLLPGMASPEALRKIRVLLRWS